MSSRALCADGVNCVSCPIRQIGICAGLDANTLRELRSASRLLHFQAGETIFSQFGECRFFGGIVSGVIKLITNTMDGRQVIVGLLKRGDFIGTSFDRLTRFDHEAVGEVHICAVEKSTIERLMRSHSEIACQILSQVSRQADELQEWLTLFSCRTTIQRLAGYLSAIATGEGSTPSAPGQSLLRIPLCRRDLATYLGMTPETLSRNFQSLARKGLLNVLDGQTVELKDLTKLKAMSGNSFGELLSLSGSSWERQFDDAA